MILIKCINIKYFFNVNYKFLSLLLVFLILIHDYSSDNFIDEELSKIQPNSGELNYNNIYKEFKSLALKYQYLLEEEKIIPEDSPIWIMWYQGIRNAPLIVQSCIKSIIINRAKNIVYILNKYNLNN